MSKKLDLAMLIVAVAVVAVLGWQYGKSRGTKPEAASETPASSSAASGDESASAAPSLEGMKRLDLAAGLESWTPEAKVDAEKVRSAVLDVKGQVAEAYLSAHVTSDEKPFTKWDSLYVKLNDLGGHLFRPQSLPAEEGTGTGLLYSLYDVPYLPTVPYSEEREPERADMLALFKPGARLYLTSFISSLRPSRIEELSIRYRCETGQDCEVSIRP